jgi:hypothetical protein
VTARERLGIVLPEVYDGISVWQESDGTYVNRWAGAVDRMAQGSNDARVLERRERIAQDWIDQQNGNLA